MNCPSIDAASLRLSTHRQPIDPVREVALMRPADESVLEPQRADNLRCARKQRHDAQHHAFANAGIFRSAIANAPKKIAVNSRSDAIVLPKYGIAAT